MDELDGDIGMEDRTVLRTGAGEEEEEDDWASRLSEAQEQGGAAAVHRLLTQNTTSAFEGLTKLQGEYDDHNVMDGFYADDEEAEVTVGTGEEGGYSLSAENDDEDEDDLVEARAAQQR